MNKLTLSVFITLLTLGTTSLAHAQTANVQGETAQAYAVPNEDGERALDMGDYARAETVFTDELKRAAKNSPDRPYFQIGLSESLLNQGRFQEATKEYKKAQSLVESRGKNDELTARLYDGLSWLNHGQGKLDDAVQYVQKAINVRKAAPDASLLLMVTSLTHLGQLLELQGQLGQAGQYYSEAIRFQDAHVGRNTLLAADLLESLGSISRRMGDAAKANQYFQQSLQIKLATSAPAAPYTPHPYWQTVTFPFLDGSPNCSKRFDQGSLQEFITANGVTVATSMQPVEATKSIKVNVYVRNDGDKEIQFLPTPPSLTITQPKISIAPQVDPTRLAESVQKKGDRKASWIRFWGSQATQTMTSTSIGGPGFFGYPPVYGGYSYGGGFGGGSYNQWYNRSGNMTIMHTSIPDYAAQARALQRAAEVSAQSHERAGNIAASGLGPTAVAPGATITGALYFDAPKIAEGTVRIPVGNAVFEYMFPPH
ncbi:MAG: tetratricopeptide repeat protein [Candidatus Obscuribacterales bacterium]|nr:tetratricopeptide repeat protein [Candidatus Obscuribacterales bacterium]